MGKTGCVISTLDMTAEQLAAHEARQARVERPRPDSLSMRLGTISKISWLSSPDAERRRPDLLDDQAKDLGYDLAK